MRIRAGFLFGINFFVLFSIFPVRKTSAGSANPNNPHVNVNDHNEDGHNDNGQLGHDDGSSETCEGRTPADAPVFPEPDGNSTVIPIVTILLDDKGKELSDGEYDIALTLRDQNDAVIFPEDTQERVTDVHRCVQNMNNPL